MAKFEVVWVRFVESDYRVRDDPNVIGPFLKIDCEALRFCGFNANVFVVKIGVSKGFEVAIVNIHANTAVPTRFEKSVIRKSNFYCAARRKIDFEVVLLVG